MKTLAVPVIAVLMLALSGCATTDAPGSQATSTPSSTPSATASAVASPAPSPTAEAPAEPVVEPEPAASCETVLTDEEYVALEEDNLRLNPDTRVYDDVMQSIMDDGFGCHWRGGGDVQVFYAQAEQPADAWEQRKQELADAGWTEINTPIQGVLQASPGSDTNHQPVVTNRDGVTYYASYPDFFSSVKALQG